MDQNSKSIPTESISNLDPSIRIDHNHHSSPHLNDTIAILTAYGLPKTSEYYTCKGQLCILDKYHNEIIQSFLQNDINIHQLYDSSIKPPEFVTNIMRYMDVEDASTSALRPAIKKLYTILQLHQHIGSKRNRNRKATTLPIDSKKLNEIKTSAATSGLQRKNERKRHRMDSMVRELSRSQSQIFSLQHQNDVLKVVADETQRKLLETEHKKHEYKQSINELQLTHTQITGKIVELEEENEELKRLVCEYEYMNTRSGSINVMDYDDEDEEEYKEEENELLMLSDAQLANLRTFYKNIHVKQKAMNTKSDTTANDVDKTKTFWDKLFDGFRCIPSFD